ncbi:MAG: DinB family protein [Anaerolineae bacterium]|nr:DinB family protein [Anaerolineae bacterium]
MSETHIRSQLVNMLSKQQAHMSIDDAVKNFPAKDFNTRPPNVEYTFWHLLEHLRITQLDILDYCRNPNYKELEWPNDYWPAKDATTDAAGWNKTLSQFHADLDELVAIVEDPSTNLYSPIAHGSGGHTIFRELLIVADHNAYHIGEFGILRQVVNNWQR